MPQCFAQLSDPHLSSLKGVRGRDLFSKRGLGYLSWRRKRRFEHRTEVLEALQRDLELSELDQLLVTGDLTHIGLPQEFEQARQWLQELGNSRPNSAGTGQSRRLCCRTLERDLRLMAGLYGLR